MSNHKEKRNRFRHRQKEQKQQLNEQRQREFAARIAPLDPERILYLPLDIGKNVHWMRTDTGAGRNVQPPIPLSSDQVGYAYWRQCLQGYLTGGAFDLVVIGHEPTGVYHETWCRHILDDFAPYLNQQATPHLRYRFLNPYQVKLERQKLTTRSRKSDPLDLCAIASLLRQGQGNPAVLPEPRVALLHQGVFFARQAARQLRATRIELMRQFDRIWPGALVNLPRFQQAHPHMPAPTPIVKSKPLERQSFRFILEHCPNPYQVRDMGLDGLMALFHQHDLRCGPATARRILACARHAVLNPPAIVDVYILGLEQLLADEQHWLKRQQWAEQQLETLVADTPARHLLTIRGLSPRWAAYYLDLVGAPPRFDWADQVWAFVGFDPNQQQSGDSNPQHPFHLSRRGATFHRHLLTWMALLVASHHPTFGLCFIAAEERGLGLWGAAIHTAHKLHRTCFRLLLDNCPYQDDTHPDDFPRWRDYWLAYRQHRRQPNKYPHPGDWHPTHRTGQAP